MNISRPVQIRLHLIGIERTNETKGIENPALPHRHCLNPTHPLRGIHHEIQRDRKSQKLIRPLNKRGKRNDAPLRIVTYRGVNVIQITEGINAPFSILTTRIETKREAHGKHPKVQSLLQSCQMLEVNKENV